MAAIWGGASGYFSGSIRITFAASARSTTRCARAAIDNPVIDMMSGVSWSMVIDTRLSSARFFAFWLSTIWKEHLVLMGNLSTAFATQLAPALIGVLYWRRATAKGAMYGILVGLVVAYLTYGVWRYPLHIHCAMWGLMANLAVFFFFAFTSKPPSKANRDKYDEVLRKGMEAHQKEEAALAK